MVNMEVIKKARQEALQKYQFTPPVGTEALKPQKVAEAIGLSGKYLEIIVGLHNNPLVSPEVLAETLGLSSMNVRRVMLYFEHKDWIRLIHFSRRTRGFVRYCDITPAGLEVAKLTMPAEGTGSFLHRHIQNRIKKDLVKKGFDAKTEFVLNNKRADIGYIHNNEKCAIEVGLSSAQNEVDNIINDYKAGFDSVAVLCRETSMLTTIHQALKEKELRFHDLTISLVTEFLEQANHEVKDA